MAKKLSEKRMKEGEEKNLKYEKKSNKIIEKENF